MFWSGLRPGDMHWQAANGLEVMVGEAIETDRLQRLARQRLVDHRGDVAAKQVELWVFNIFELKLPCRQQQAVTQFGAKGFECFGHLVQISIGDLAEGVKLNFRHVGTLHGTRQGQAKLPQVDFFQPGENRDLSSGVDHRLRVKAA